MKPSLKTIKAMVSRILDNTRVWNLERSVNIPASLFTSVTKFPIVFKPISLGLDRTTYCNIRCRICIRALGKDCRFQHIKNEVLEKVLFLLPYTESLWLGGIGETLMHPDFVKIISIIKSNSVKISMVTNGTLLNKEIAKYMCQLNIESVYFSIDGATSRTHKKSKGSNFDQVVNAIRSLMFVKRQLRLNHPVVGIFFVGMRSNIAELPDLIEMASKIGVERIARAERIRIGASFERVIKSIKLLYSMGKSFNLNFVVLRQNIHELPEIISKFGRTFVLYPEAMTREVDYMHPHYEPKRTKFYFEKCNIRKPLNPTSRRCEFPFKAPSINVEGEICTCYGMLPHRIENWYMGTKIEIDPQEFIYGKYTEFEKAWYGKKINRIRQLVTELNEDQSSHTPTEYCELRRRGLNNICKVCPWRLHVSC